MEKKGFISKIQIDKRTNQIELTPLSQKVLEESSQEVKDFRQNLISNLSENEVQELIRLLEKVALNVKE